MAKSQRQFYVSSEQLHGCCKVDTLYGFSEQKTVRKALSDDEWKSFLLENLQSFDNYYGEKVNNLLVFSHSTKENKGQFTPAKLAEWLYRKFQVGGHLTYKHITVYTFILDDAFIKDLEKHAEKET